MYRKYMFMYSLCIIYVLCHVLHSQPQESLQKHWYFWLIIAVCEWEKQKSWKSPSMLFLNLS